jgi:membrane protease YdiL (CAAX protease family)
MENPSTYYTSSPPVGMLFPAFSSLIIEILFVEESALFHKNKNGSARLVAYSFICLTFLSVMAILGSLYLGYSPLASLVTVLFTLWTLLVIQAYTRSGEESFRRLGLQLGDLHKGVPFVAGIVLFFLVQVALNVSLGWGMFKGLQGGIEGIPIPPVAYPIALVAFFILSVVGAPLGSLAATFGEEYGWRGFMLRELSPLGLRLSTLITGVIWTTWHVPVIDSGAHTYPPTATGYLMACVFFTLWSYVQTFALLKTGSVWAPVFLHGVVNSVYSFTLRYLVRPDDILLSFGLGAYGLIILAIIVFFVLRDPIWDTQLVGLEPVEG